MMPASFSNIGKNIFIIFQVFIYLFTISCKSMHQLHKNAVDTLLSKWYSMIHHTQQKLRTLYTPCKEEWLFESKLDLKKLKNS